MLTRIWLGATRSRGLESWGKHARHHAVNYLLAIYGSTCVATCIGMYNIELLYSDILLMFV